MRNKGQVWIETVIYTLIGLALIGVVLAIITPKINDFKDRSVIDQSINSLEAFDSKVEEVLVAPANKRKVEFRMKKGELYVNPTNDTIYFVLEDSRAAYSEPGIPISLGRVKILTEENGKRYSVKLSLIYNHDITFDGDNEDEVKFSAASIPYNFIIENKGFTNISEVNIDITS